MLVLQDAPSEPTAARIELADEAVALPARVSAGAVSFTVANTGTAPHDVRFVRLAAGHTLDQFKTWKASGKPIPTMVPNTAIRSTSTKAIDTPAL